MHRVNPRLVPPERASVSGRKGNCAPPPAMMAQSAGASPARAVEALVQVVCEAGRRYAAPTGGAGHGRDGHGVDGRAKGVLRLGRLGQPHWRGHTLGGLHVVRVPQIVLR